VEASPEEFRGITKKSYSPRFPHSCASGNPVGLKYVWTRPGAYPDENQSRSGRLTDLLRDHHTSDHHTSMDEAKGVEDYLLLM